MSNILTPSSARQSFTTLKLGALENIRALVTTKWSRGYTQRIMTNIESFFIDSSIDNDADSWEIQFGDPTGEYLALLERNNEVRVELISSAKGAAGHIFSGIADDITYDQSGVLTLTGRDYSSLALDSVCPPSRWKQVKAKYVVATTARKLGYTNISLSQAGEVKKTIKTDGSESFWEFWYRLYRNEKMWLWVGPNGALIGSKLNYSAQPSYYFGTPQATDSEIIKEMYVPVETVEIRKSTQGRLGEVWVLVKDGKNTFMVTTGMKDPTMQNWVKRPFKIIQDNVSHDAQHARQKGWEEIFEGKVGSLEIRLTVSMPNWVFRTNRIAKLRIPEIGYGGEFFVIGWKMQADADGWVQEVRLREKYIALSRRVPQEPVMPVQNRLPPDVLPGHNTPTASTKDILSQLIPSGTHPGWGDFFYKAAQHWANGWDMDLALASILGVAYIESTISNIRENTGHHDHTEWVPRPTTGIEEGNPPPAWIPGFGQTPTPARSLTSLIDEWQDTFVNEQADVVSRGISDKELGVGPFQLTSTSLKIEADDYASKRRNLPTNHSQYDGGRWDPESNIWVGARYFLQDCLKATHLSPSSGDQMSAMWQAYGYFHHGPNYTGSLESDIAKLRAVVLHSPGFLNNLVKPAVAAIRANSQTSADGNTEGSIKSDIMPDGWPSPADCLAAFTSGTWSQGAVSNVDPPPPKLPPITFLQAYYYNIGRSLPINYLVIHTMENSETSEQARNVANMFAQGATDGPASAHYCLDDKNIFQSVKDGDTAYGVIGSTSLGSINAQSIHFEHAGIAAQTSTDWSDQFSTNMLANSAKLVAQKAKQFNVPIQYCTPAMLTAGQHGISGHGDFTTAFPVAGGHVDPGPNFPWTQFIAMVTAAAT